MRAPLGKEKIFAARPRRRQFMTAVLLVLTCVCSFSASPQQSPPRELEKLRLQLSSSEVEARRDAVLQLGTRRTSAASRLAASALQDARPIVRATAARAVLALPGEEAASLLIPLLKDRDDFVRREAAYALGIARSKSAVAALALALAEDKEPGVRGASAVALEQIKDPTSVPALIAVVSRRRSGRGVNRLLFRKEEENEFVRRAAVAALGQIGGREAVATLIAALANEQSGDDVRREAARSLGQIGDTTAVAALRAALRARDPYLSEIARQAVEKVTSDK